MEAAEGGSSISEFPTVLHVLCTHLFQDSLEHLAVLLWFHSYFIQLVLEISVLELASFALHGELLQCHHRHVTAGKPWSWDPSASSHQGHSLFRKGDPDFWASHADGTWIKDATSARTGSCSGFLREQQATRHTGRRMRKPRSHRSSCSPAHRHCLPRCTNL